MCKRESERFFFHSLLLLCGLKWMSLGLLELVFKIINGFGSFKLDFMPWFYSSNYDFLLSFFFQLVALIQHQRTDWFCRLSFWFDFISIVECTNVQIKLSGIFIEFSRLESKERECSVFDSEQWWIITIRQSIDLSMCFSLWIWSRAKLKW